MEWDQRFASPTGGDSNQLVVPIILILLCWCTFSFGIVVLFVDVTASMFDVPMLLFDVALELLSILFAYSIDLLLDLDPFFGSRLDTELFTYRLAGKHKSINMILTVPALVRFNPSVAMGHLIVTKNSGVYQLLVLDLSVWLPFSIW